jgi:hypothetical protein
MRTKYWVQLFLGLAVGLVAGCAQKSPGVAQHSFAQEADPTVVFYETGEGGPIVRALCPRNSQASRQNVECTITHRMDPTLFRGRLKRLYCKVVRGGKHLRRIERKTLDKLVDEFKSSTVTTLDHSLRSKDEIVNIRLNASQLFHAAIGVTDHRS